MSTNSTTGEDHWVSAAGGANDSLADADGGTELLTVQDGLPCLLARSRKRLAPP